MFYVLCRLTAIDGKVLMHMQARDIRTMPTLTRDMIWELKKMRKLGMQALCCYNFPRNILILPSHHSWNPQLVPSTPWGA